MMSGIITLFNALRYILGFLKKRNILVPPYFIGAKGIVLGLWIISSWIPEILPESPNIQRYAGSSI